jgi:outer membrane protein assembly factor BamB
VFFHPIHRNILAILFAVSAIHAAFPADWPQFLGPTRNCTSTETGLLLDWPRGGPPKLWEKPVGEGYSSPVIVGDRLILFHRVGNQEVVECLHPATGKPTWKFGYPSDYRDSYGKGDGPRSTPVIAGKHVFTLGAGGQLHCIELETGKKVWERSITTDYQVKESFFGVGTSPLVEKDRLLLNVGGGTGAGIVAFDVQTGKEVWKAADDDASYSSPVAATIDGVRQAVFLTRAGVVIVDPDTGKVRFTKPFRSRLGPSVNAATPVVVDDLVFFSSEYGVGGMLLKVNRNGADEVWNAKTALTCHYNTAVHRDGFLYGIDGRQEGGAELRCVELRTGKVRWGRPGSGCASLILADGHLFAMFENGELALIEATPAAYREKARFTALAAPVRAEIALADGRLYARDNGKLCCWNVKKR